MARSLLDVGDAKSRISARTRKLLWRSLWSMLGVCVLILFLGLLPRSPQAQPETSLFAERDESDGTLKHVIVLHRHGARTPIDWYGFEGNWAFEGLGLGILTVHGMYQGFALGQRLRQQYGEFLTVPAIVNGVTTRRIPLENLNVSSTNYDRTVDTVNALLLGLFSRVGTEAAEKPCTCRPAMGARSSPTCIATCLDLLTVPETPPVTVRDSKTDRAVQQASLCSGFVEWFAALVQSDFWRAQVPQHFSAAFNAVRSMIGRDVVRAYSLDKTPQSCYNLTDPDFNTLGFLESVWSNLMCYDAFDGRRYWVGPKSKTNEQMLQLLQPAADFYWHQRFAGGHGSQEGGMLLNEMISILRGVVERETGARALRGRELLSGTSVAEAPAKMTIYSAHDNTVFSLLAAFNGTANAVLPGFASNVILELWQVSEQPLVGVNDFSIRVKYNGELVTDALGCPGGKCSFADFLAGTNDVAVSPDTCTPPTPPTLPQANCTLGA